MTHVWIVLMFDFNGSGGAQISIVYPGAFMSEREALIQAGNLTKQGIIAWVEKTEVGAFPEKAKRKKK